MLVGLAEEEASSWWGLKEPGYQQAAETVGKRKGALADGCYSIVAVLRDSRCLLDDRRLSGRGVIGYEGNHGPLR